MTYCYCCVYAQMIEIGRYLCINNSSFNYNEEVSDVSDCFDFTFDDQFYEYKDHDDAYDKCYLKDICIEKYCELFND